MSTHHVSDLAGMSDGSGRKEDVIGVVTHIQPYSLHDGPGIRTVVFLKGCPLECAWCCNPECQTVRPEIQFFASRCVQCGACLKACQEEAVNSDLSVATGFKIDRRLCSECGQCVEVCPREALCWVGETMTVGDVMKVVEKDRAFYSMSGGGLTVSGGEALYQFDFTLELLRRSYDSHISVVLETCGYVPWERLEKVVPYLDMVLYDIKHMDPIMHEKGTGKSNELILDNLKRLDSMGIPLVIRLPLIPEFNLNADNICKTAAFIASLRNVREVNLMPFHQLGKDKYSRLSRGYALDNYRALEAYDEGRERIRTIKTVLASHNLTVHVG